MAGMRSASLPPLGGHVAEEVVANPFWSAQTRAEAELRARRPVDLPVPQDDDEFDEPRRKSSRSVSSPKPLEERPRGRGRSAEGQNRIFTTPASWGSVDGPLRTAGLMRDGDLEEERSRVFGGTQGPAPKGEVRGEPGELQQDILERALEREMVSILHKENLQLKEELQAMKERMSSTAWSEVTPSVDVPRPPEGTPPRSGGLRMEEGWEILHTPNGTRVPTGPPPPEMPPWPFHYYEKEEGMADCMKWLGPWEDEGLRRLTLHDPVYGGGNDSRHGLRDGGRNSRMMRDGSHPQGLCEGGRQSRRDEELMSAAEARAVWMERELHGMKQALDHMKRAGLNSGYWSEPAKREERGRGGLPREDRAWQHDELHEHGRAQHPDLPQQGRAQHPDLPQQGRAQHPDLPQQGRAQHSELPQQGRAEHHDLLQHGQAEQQDLPHQDRAEHEDLPHQGRAGLEKEEKNGVALCHGRGQGQGLHDGKGHGHEDEGNRAPPYPGSEQGGQGSKMELPALPQETTPMDLGDWLTLITPSMKDMANNASFWWECTLAEATRFYEQWRQSTPLQRVQLKPALPEELKTRQFERTEQRGVGLLLRALPGEMRNVIISNRDMASTAILWRLLITFQPGGNGEKGQLLKVLTTSSTVSTASQLASHLRQWRRCFTRAREIGACVPDGTLMVYALESSAMALGKMDGQAAFRIASSRAQLGVDEKPEAETVLLYSQVLLAEAETLTLSGTSSTTSGTTATAKVKAMQTQFGKGSPPTTSTSSPCKFWGSEAGCKFGKACKYDHPVLEDQKDRCWICSSAQHRKVDCPAKGMTPHGSGGSGQDGKGGTSSTSMAKGGNGKGQKGKQGQIQGGSSQPAQGQVQDKPAVNKLEKEMNDKIEKETLSKQNEATTTGSTGTSPEQPTTGETELLSEVTSLLRSLRAPQLKVAYVKKLDPNETTSYLLDGGATNPLRQCKSKAEWEAATPTVVNLALGEVTLRQKDNGTLLTQGRIQPIIPVQDLTMIGVKVIWQEGQCHMELQGSKLGVYMDQGCPCVGATEGRRLMEQVEEMHTRKVALKTIKSRPRTENVTEDEKSMRFFYDLFPNAPQHIAERVIGFSNYDPSRLPWNRRTRKRIEEATTLVIHLYCGKNKNKWQALEREVMQEAEQGDSPGLVILCVDIEHGGDMHNPHIMGYLESLARRGKVAMMIGGPPCRTVSAARLRDDDGPRAVRGRGPENRWGLQRNTIQEQTLCDGDSALWLKMMWLTILGRYGNPDMEATIEQPQDPEEWQAPWRPRPDFGFASYLTWPETFMATEIAGLMESKFDQGRFGHAYCKPTTLLTSSQEMREMDGLS